MIIARLLFFWDGNSPYYNVDLKGIHVAGKKLGLSPSVFDGRYGTVLDSGTTYAYLPEEAFGAFKDAVSFYSLNLLFFTARSIFTNSEFEDCCMLSKNIIR